MLENLTDNRIKKMTLPQLSELCEEARQKIISTVYKNGGHLSSNLGMVELTVALDRKSTRLNTRHPKK